MKLGVFVTGPGIFQICIVYILCNSKFFASKQDCRVYHINHQVRTDATLPMLAQNISKIKIECFANY